MKIETLNPIGNAAWEEFLQRDPGATVFHTGAWASVLHDTYGFEPRYLAASNGSSGIEAGIALFSVTGDRLVGLPFSDLCPPLLPDSDVGAALLNDAKQLVDQKSATLLELRGRSDLELTSLEKGDEFLQHVVPLDGSAEELQSRLHSSARRALRKAEREGITVRESTTMEDMRRFYGLMVKTRRKHGLIPQPWRFFENIQKHLMEAGMGYMLLAEYKGETIAGDLLLAYKEGLTYKFNASDPKYLQLRPNNSVLWRAITSGAERGYKWLDLGRCEEDNEGLRRFKLLWGAEERALGYYFYPSVKAGASHQKASPLTRRVLALLVKYAPDWALQQAGAAVYKNFA